MEGDKDGSDWSAVQENALKVRNMVFRFRQIHMTTSEKYFRKDLCQFRKREKKTNVDAWGEIKKGSDWSAIQGNA